jgi:histidinol-phosphate aminotransferase
MPAIASLTRYGAGAGDASLADLSDNTNRWGTPPAAREAIVSAATASYRYPTLYGETLATAVAAYAGVSVSSVVTGCGSDNVIDAAMKAFVGPGRRVAYCAPTFVMVPTFIQWAGATAVTVPFLPDGDIDADALLATDADLIYLCAPNNPTGVAPSPAAVARVLDGARGVVLVDEAYFEFSNVTVADRVATHERLLVARTFSKAFGLAGLRVGYGLAHPTLVGALERARGPYTMNAIGEAAAVAALSHDLPWVHARVNDAIAAREQLTAVLRDTGHQPYPSAANFVLVPVADAGAFAATMRTAGLLVRPFRALPGIGDAVRITVGPPDVMTRLITAIRSLA